MREMLMLSDREEISRGLAEGLSYKQIASVVGRDRSVISREVRRHGGRYEYRAAAAQETGPGGAGAAEAVRGGPSPAVARDRACSVAWWLVTGLDRGPVADRAPR
ncbi:hypothetical protein Ae717Ps2_7141 [Pseudonocardia sp. Ae717_Ps2]|nr:hypothetical protein Ae717Ps2_7141 [Pseudonocardia sp. Ae717_Ps2]